VLCQEIELTPHLGSPLATVFFGGGTPSLLTARQLEQILESLHDRFEMIEGWECSIEIDPGTFDLAKLQDYVALGINRFSLGVQTFQPVLLAHCGRSHTVADVYEALDLIHQVGIENWSIDLISGLPNQTWEDWQETLQRAVAIDPPHLSIYDLTLEPQTVFGKRYQPGLAPLPSEETTAQMYRLAQQVLTAAGYEHYEISNYAKPGAQCRHNRVYWENRAYYGFGMGAASYTQQRRFTRPRKTQDYFDWVQKLAESGSQVFEAMPIATPLDQLLDRLMLGLRLAEGIALGDLEQCFGREIVDRILETIAPYRQQGWVLEEFGVSPAETLRERGSEFGVQEKRGVQRAIDTGGTEQGETRDPQDSLRLSDPEGFLFSNTILAELFHHLTEAESKIAGVAVEEGSVLESMLL
jgi:oxygen-independent coproporphyrinogen-3 oxidase